MHYFDMAIQMVLIPKLHHTQQTLKLFLVGMGDHMPPEVRTTFKYLLTLRESARKLRMVLLVLFPHMAVQVGSLVKSLFTLLAL
jgi:hypothetical protein